MDEVYRSFETALNKGNLTQAETVARHMWALDKEDERSHVAVARVFVAKGKLDEAISRLERLLLSRNNCFLAMAFLASFHQQKGDEIKALEYATRSVQAGQRVPASLVIMGDAALKRGEGQAALSWFGGALKTQPSNVSAWKGLAAALRLLKRRVEVVQALENAVSIQSGDPTLWIELLKAMVDNGDAQGACDKAQDALKAHPRDPDLLKLANQIRALGTTTSDPLAREIASTRDLLRSGNREAAEQKLAMMLKYHRPTRALKFLRAEVQASGPKQNVPQLMVETMALAKEYTEAWEPRALLADLLCRRSAVRNLKQAMTYADEAWTMSGGNPYAGLAMIRVFAASGKIPMAQAVATQLKTVKPELEPIIERIMEKKEGV